MMLAGLLRCAFMCFPHVPLASPRPSCLSLRRWDQTSIFHVCAKFLMFVFLGVRGSRLPQAHTLADASPLVHGDSGRIETRLTLRGTCHPRSSQEWISLRETLISSTAAAGFSCQHQRKFWSEPNSPTKRSLRKRHQDATSCHVTGLWRGEALRNI